MKNYKTIYPEITEIELKCLMLRAKGVDYSTIQSNLGSPSKKWIRKTLLKYDPSLINAFDAQKIPKYNSAYSELYNILSHTSNTIWNFWGEEIKCYIKDHKIYLNDDPLEWWSETEQKQVLEAIKEQWK